MGYCVIKITYWLYLYTQHNKTKRMHFSVTYFFPNSCMVFSQLSPSYDISHMSFFSAVKENSFKMPIKISHLKFYIFTVKLTKCCDWVVSTLTSYFEGPRLDSWPRSQLSWWSYSVAFLSPSSQILTQYLKTGHTHFPSHPSEFITCNHLPIQSYINYTLDIMSLNKL